MNKALERIAALAKRLSSAELQILMQLAADEANLANRASSRSLAKQRGISRTSAKSATWTSQNPELTETGYNSMGVAKPLNRF